MVAITDQTIINASLSLTGNLSLENMRAADLQRMLPEFLLGYRYALGSLSSQASVDGGRATMARAAPYRARYAQSGGDSRMAQIDAAISTRGLRPTWDGFAARQRVSFWSAVGKPLLQAGVTLAAVYGVAVGGSALLSKAGLSGVSASSSFQAGTAQLSAIQGSATAAKVAAVVPSAAPATVAAKAATSAAAAPAGTAATTSAAASAGLETTGVSASGAASVSTGAAVTNDVISAGVGTMTTVAQPSGLDAVFQSIGNLATTAIDATGVAAVNRIVGSGSSSAASQPVGAQAAGAGFRITPGMVAAGVGIVVGIGLLIAFAGRGK